MKEKICTKMQIDGGLPKSVQTTTYAPNLRAKILSGVPKFTTYHAILTAALPAEQIFRVPQSYLIQTVAIL